MYLDQIQFEAETRFDTLNDVEFGNSGPGSASSGAAAVHVTQTARARCNPPV